MMRYVQLNADTQGVKGALCPYAQDFLQDDEMIEDEENEITIEQIIAKAQLDYDIAQYMKNHCENCKHYNAIMQMCNEYERKRLTK